MSIIEKATAQMEAWAADPAHGYDQSARWGPNYDCSSAVITAWEWAGVPVKSRGATYTGNMYSVFKACGFADVTASCDLSTGAGMERGDVLLNHVNHTAMYCGNGSTVEASINEFGGTTGGMSGDQTGREFHVRGYRNYPWDCVLRYAGGNAPATETESSTEAAPAETIPRNDFSLGFRYLRKDAKGEDVRAWQRLLKAAGFDVGRYGTDGEFGTDTLEATKKYQRSIREEADGIVGPATLGHMLGLK